MTRTHASAESDEHHAPLLKDVSQKKAGNGLFYGWFIVPITTLSMICTSPGQTFGIMMFRPFIQDDLGISKAQFAGAYAIATFLAALPQTSIGTFMDRYGARYAKLGVVLLLGAACIVTSQAATLIWLFIAFLMLRTFGSTGLGMLTGAATSLWFKKKLGIVMSIAHVGFSLSIALYPGLCLLLIEHYGWRSAYVILGLGVWIVMIPALLFVFRNRPEDVGRGPDGSDLVIDAEGDLAQAGDYSANTPDQHREISFTLKQAMRTRSFWIVCAGSAFFAITMTAIPLNLALIFEAREMAEPNRLAAKVMLIFGFTQAILQLPIGLLSDRIRLQYLLIAKVALLSMALAILLFSSAVWPLGITMGLLQCCFVVAYSTIWVRYYGRKHIGKIKGFTIMSLVFGASVGSYVLDLAYELIGGYQTGLAVLALLGIPLTIASFFATPPRAPAELRQSDHVPPQPTE